MELYSSIKNLSMVAAGLFGVIGVLTNYKDKEGRVTKWGRFAAIGIGISLTCSLVLYSLESAKSKRANEVAARQNRETRERLEAALRASKLQADLLKTALAKVQVLEGELNSTARSLIDLDRSSEAMARTQTAMIRAQLWEMRSLSPIDPLDISYVFAIPFDQPGFSSYLSRVKGAIEESRQPPDLGINIGQCWLMDCSKLFIDPMIESRPPDLPLVTR